MKAYPLQGPRAGQRFNPARGRQATNPAKGRDHFWHPLKCGVCRPAGGAVAARCPAVAFPATWAQRRHRRRARPRRAPRAAHRLRRSRYRGNRGADSAPAGIVSRRHFQTVLAPVPGSGAEGASEGGDGRGAMRPQAEEAAAGAEGECRCGGGRPGRGGGTLAVASREVPAGRARVLPGGRPRGWGGSGARPGGARRGDSSPAPRPTPLPFETRQ